MRKGSQVYKSHQKGNPTTRDRRFKTAEELHALHLREMVERAQDGPEIEIEFVEDNEKMTYWDRVEDKTGRTGTLISFSRDITGWVYVQWDDFFTCPICEKIDNLEVCYDRKNY